MKRTAMPARSAPLRSGAPLHRTGRITPVSAKRAKQNRAYAVLRVEFLTSRPRCEFPGGCGSAASVVHHTRGRRGERLNDTAWWKASCDFHNDFAETRTGEALAMGWLHRIEGAA